MINPDNHIRVKFNYSATGLWRMKYQPSLNKSTHCMIQPKSLNLPEDIANRLKDWSIWVDSEMTRQKAYWHNANVEADEFNRIGREIAKAIKLFLGDEYHIEYVPVEKTGRVRSDKAETIT